MQNRLLDETCNTVGVWIKRYGHLEHHGGAHTRAIATSTILDYLYLIEEQIA